MFLSIPPENIEKPKGFLMFSGCVEKQNRAVKFFKQFVFSSAILVLSPTLSHLIKYCPLQGYIVFWKVLL